MAGTVRVAVAPAIGGRVNMGKAGSDAGEPEPDPPAERVLETAVSVMRVVFAWPDEGRHRVTALASVYSMCVSLAVMGLANISFVIYGEYEHIVNALGCINDAAAGGVVIAKIICLHRHGQEASSCLVNCMLQLLALRRSLQHAFKDVEAVLAPAEARAANTRCLDRARTFCRWLTLLYFPLCASGFAINVASALLSREERHLSIKAPAFVTRSDWLYWPVFSCSQFVFATFSFISGGYDMLFLSLCMHVSCKCNILQVLIRHACQRRMDGPGSNPGRAEDEGGWHQYWRDDGSAIGPAPSASEVQVERALRACATYHQQIIKLRDTTEHVFASVSLAQMGYVLMGLGIPALRVLYEKSLDFTGLVFLMLYTSWNFSQLLFYCWFADRVAHSSQEVSVAAYSALRPDAPAGPPSGLTARAAATLNFLTLRAQRPLHLTAGHFVNLTLELYLEIIRRSQSFYSYLLRLR